MIGDADDFRHKGFDIMVGFEEMLRNNGISWRTQKIRPSSVRYEVVSPLCYYTRLVGDISAPIAKNVAMKIISDIACLYGEYMKIENGESDDIDVIKDILFDYDVYKKRMVMLSDTRLSYSIIHELVGVVGLYRLYDKDKKLKYIGKSINLGSRLPSSSKRKGTVFYDYCAISNISELLVYESYYISKYKPEFNVDGKYNGDMGILLPELKFSPITKWKRVCDKFIGGDIN